MNKICKHELILFCLIFFSLSLFGQSELSIDSMKSLVRNSINEQDKEKLISYLHFPELLTISIDENNNTPLEYAIWEHKNEVVFFLVDLIQKEDSLLLTDYGIFSSAILSGNCVALKKIEPFQSQKIIDKDGIRLLGDFIVLYNNLILHDNTCKYLESIPDNSDLCMLDYFLSNKRIDFNYCDDNGQTILIKCRNNINIVKKLCTKIDINRVDNSGRGMLSYLTEDIKVLSTANNETTQKALCEYIKIFDFVSTKNSNIKELGQETINMLFVMIQYKNFNAIINMNKCKGIRDILNIKENENIILDFLEEFNDPFWANSVKNILNFQ